MAGLEEEEEEDIDISHQQQTHTQTQTPQQHQAHSQPDHHRHTRTTAAHMSPQPDTSSSPPSSTFSRLTVFTTTVPNSVITPVCGAVAGLASGVVTCPLDVIKTRLQAQGSSAAYHYTHLQPQNKSIFHLPLHLSSQAGKRRYHGMLGTGKTILREEGVRGFYRGLAPMLIGYLPTWAVYMTVYEKMTVWYGQKSGLSVPPRPSLSVTPIFG